MVLTPDDIYCTENNRRGAHIGNKQNNKQHKNPGRYRPVSKTKRKLARATVYPETEPFVVKPITPKTINQRRVFVEYGKGKNIFCHGMPGTGKTFLGLYLALKSIEDGLYEQLIIVRSAVPSRNQGFLPGAALGGDKDKVFELIYPDMVQEFYNVSGAYETLKRQGKIKFSTTSYNRGLTWNNAVILIDEAQNFTDRELHTTITRLGQNVRLFIAGDIHQTDLDTESKKYSEKTGISDFSKIVREMEEFSFIEMTAEDIVRGPFLKQYILARHRLEEQGEIHAV